MPNGGEQVILAHSSVDLSSAWMPLQTTSAIALVALTGTLSAHENHLLSCWFFTLLHKKLRIIVTYLSNLWTHFTLVFPSWRSIWWMWMMNMARATVAWGTLSVAGSLSAFGSVDGLRYHEAGLTGWATRGWRWGRGWWVTAVTV